MAYVSSGGAGRSRGTAGPKQSCSDEGLIGECREQLCWGMICGTDIIILSMFKFQVSDQCRIGIKFLPLLLIDGADHVTVDTESY